MLKITLAQFDFGDELEKIPELELSASGNDYWILLPVFEDIEEKTGKLIDLGDPVAFNSSELDLIESVLEEQTKKLSKEVDEDSLLERDNETLKKLLEKLSAMVNLAARYNVDLITEIA